MNAIALLSVCQDRGITITVEGDRIHVAGLLDDVLIAQLRSSKEELLAVLSQPPGDEPLPLPWLTDSTSSTVGSQMVRCLDCRHCEPNEHRPLQGWCTCGLGCRRDHGWPAARRLCRRFQPEGQADA